MSSFLLWTDLEAAGDKTDDPILEWGAVITKNTFPWEEIVSYSAVCKPEDPEWDQGMKNIVREMHTKNGLLDDVYATNYRLSQIEDDILGLMDAVGRPQRFTLAGSGVSHYDRRLIIAQAPRVNKWLRFVNFDIGDVRRLLKFAGRNDLTCPGLTQDTPGESQKAHRGLADIRDHMAEARVYGGLVRGLGSPPVPL